MSDNEINVAIAEACGFHIKPDLGGSGNTCLFNKNGQNISPWCKYEKDAWKYVPDYCHDLNAMREAEEIGLKPRDWFNYLPALHEVCDKTVSKVVHSTARQRAEAFLRTIGKWS